MVTSNSILCEDDSAVQSRILVLPFDQMPKSNGLPELHIPTIPTPIQCHVCLDALVWASSLYNIFRGLRVLAHLLD